MVGHFSIIFKKLVYFTKKPIHVHISRIRFEATVSARTYNVDFGDVDMGICQIADDFGRRDISEYIPCRGNRRSDQKGTLFGKHWYFKVPRVFLFWAKTYTISSMYIHFCLGKV
jgi:hypothetical protein